MNLKHISYRQTLVGSFCPVWHTLLKIFWKKKVTCPTVFWMDIQKSPHFSASLCNTFCFLMPSISPASFLQRITLLSHSKGRGRKVWRVRKGSLESDCSNQSTFLSTQPISNSWVFHDPCTLVLFTPGVIGWNFFSSSKSVTQVSFDFYFPIICWNPFFFLYLLYMLPAHGQNDCLSSGYYICTPFSKKEEGMKKKA